MPEAALVLTTIFERPILDFYFNNFAKYGHLESVKVFLIPDRKTPSSVFTKCKEFDRQGWRVFCPTIEEQESFLRQVGFPPHLIPYDSDNRRNIGFLMALESAADFVLSIDDDNFCRPDEDFFAAHSIVLQDKFETPALSTDSGWYNLCDLLQFNQTGTTYPRGFPYFARHRQDNLVDNPVTASIHMNAGLWLRDPDVDGISWLVNPMLGESFKGPSVVLAQDTWTPVNTQNTALRTDVIASYYFVRMNYPLMGGMDIDRYGDIFSGYYAQACMRHLGGSLRIGTPVVEHNRNSHNYLHDAIREMGCITVLEDLLPWLTREAKLEGNSYPETYISLSYLLEEAVEKLRGKFWNDATRGYFHQTAYHMRKWAEVCATLRG